MSLACLSRLASRFRRARCPPAARRWRRAGRFRPVSQLARRSQRSLPTARPTRYAPGRMRLTRPQAATGSARAPLATPAPRSGDFRRCCCPSFSSSLSQLASPGPRGCARASSSRPSKSGGKTAARRMPLGTTAGVTGQAQPRTRSLRPITSRLLTTQSSGERLREPAPTAPSSRTLWNHRHRHSQGLTAWERPRTQATRGPAERRHPSQSTVARPRAVQGLTVRLLSGA